MRERIARRGLLKLLAAVPIAAPVALSAACTPRAAAPAPTAPAPGQAAPAKPAEAKPAEAKPAEGKPAAPVAQPAPAQAAAKAAGAKDLTWWVTNVPFAEPLAKEYGEANGVAIAVQVQGNYDQMVQKVQAGIAANSVPHLAILGQRHGIPQIADSQRLVPVADLIKGDAAFNEQDFLPAFWKKFTYKDRIQTLPFINSSPALHYNKTAFQKAGLDPDKPPTTWDELVAAAKALTVREGNQLVQRGLDAGEDTPWYAYALIWQHGGEVLGADGAPAFNRDAGVGALQFWKDLVHTHRVMAPLQRKESEQDFVAGRVAMYFRSSSQIGGLEKQIGSAFEYGVARFPADKRRAVPVGGASLGIFKSDAAHEATAWDFARWLVSPEINARVSRETGYVANRASALELPEMREYLAKNPRRVVAIQQVREDIVAENVNPADAVVWLGLEKALEQLEADANADPKRLLDALATETTKYLKEY